MNEYIKSLIFRCTDSMSERAILVLDAEYKIIYANSIVLKNANLTLTQLSGKSMLYDFYNGVKFDSDGNYLSLLIKSIDKGQNIPVSIIKPSKLCILPKSYYRSQIMVDKDKMGRVKYVIGLYEAIDREKELETRLGTINFQIVKSMIKALDARDNPTSCHSETVADIATRFAIHLNLKKKQVDQIYLASLVHDIGKIGVPETILNKPGKLTNDEYEVVKKHTTIGHDILNEIESLSHVSETILHHHERYDGTGYPDRLAGQAIPLNSRIISICDSFEAMTSRRVYKSTMPTTIACNEIKTQRGKQFDPELADKFIEFLYPQSP